MFSQLTTLLLVVLTVGDGVSASLLKDLVRSVINDFKHPQLHMNCESVYPTECSLFKTAQCVALCDKKDTLRSLYHVVESVPADETFQNGELIACARYDKGLFGKKCVRDDGGACEYGQLCAFFKRTDEFSDLVNGSLAAQTIQAFGHQSVCSTCGSFQFTTVTNRYYNPEISVDWIPSPDSSGDLPCQYDGGVGLCTNHSGVRYNCTDYTAATLKDPSKKYRKFQPIDLPDRQWPSKTLDKPPRWLSTDLRDGNQSLVDPMDGEQKWRYFKMLVQLGYKEIEVSFPSASQTDFDFTRRVVETPGATPSDVWLQVLSPCREDLIRRSVDSLHGAGKAILHLYLATSECFQRIVFGFTQEEGLKLAVKCVQYARSITKDDRSQDGTEWVLEFSPETFSDTSPEYVVRICEAVKAAWEPTEEQPIIFNLPATVEMSTPNVYADQIEYFCRRMTEREKFCVSLHPHNDRGCATAAAELAQMAGAQRVEGCLFGNGERTGNVDLVTLALNLYTQGIHPNVDFSDITAVIDIVEDCNKIPVHARAPYGGQLVCCAFSGSHQDAINKGFQSRKKGGAATEDLWQMPYLPLDPQDIGRTYEAIIRVNSQSGKGGVAWIIQRSLELDLPRGLQVAFSHIVQEQADALGRELLPREIQSLFEKAYHLKETARFSLVDYDITVDRTSSPVPPEPGRSQNTQNLRRQFTGVISMDGVERRISGVGNGAISSMARALHGVGIDLDVADYKEHAIGQGRDVKAATYIACTSAGSKEQVWGVGIHQDAVQASLIAVLSAASSFLSSRPQTPLKMRSTNTHNSQSLGGALHGHGSTKSNGVVGKLEAMADRM
ncbi:MAG: hypothetical protein M1838_004477 [Thelocarpon superellum]|nr:MAG: hypothetical protein M1838_004477 [Thelocarpon superellum]